MKHLHRNVRVGRHPTNGVGYFVSLPDGAEEWYAFAWQATARASGWTPPGEAPAKKAITVEDIYRVDRSAVERQLGHPIRTVAPWPEKGPQ